jgi:phenylalanyl-tRNA synthetase alpha chain
MDPEATQNEARERVEACADAAALADVERHYLGRKGVLAGMLASIGALPTDERRARGQIANRLKQAIKELVDARAAVISAAELSAERSGTGFDATLPPARLETGSLHPVTQVTRELEDLFLSMGYSVLDGPEVELDYYNFEALNVPRDHPARDSHDTFFCEGFCEEFCDERSGEEARLVLRTHTSPVQVRAMERLAPPFRVIAPGKCFRQETTDASHDHTFYQMEGMVVDREVSVAHLIGAMRTLLRGIFRQDLDVRLRPGYFPFVEPGFELDARCPFCQDGCSVCKRTTWIELLPCGLVHPNVLRAGGIDPEEWSGFAFGLGLSRLVMLRYGIDDVRHLFGGDLRFLEQF